MPLARLLGVEDGVRADAQHALELFLLDLLVALDAHLADERALVHVVGEHPLAVRLARGSAVTSSKKPSRRGRGRRRRPRTPCTQLPGWAVRRTRIASSSTRWLPAMVTRSMRTPSAGGSSCASACDRMERKPHDRQTDHQRSHALAPLEVQNAGDVPDGREAVNSAYGSNSQGLSPQSGRRRIAEREPRALAGATALRSGPLRPSAVSSYSNRPPCSRSVRSASAARRSLWVTITSVMPRRAVELEEQLVHLVGGGRIEVAGRLVGEDGARRRGRRRARRRRAAARRPRARRACARAGAPSPTCASTRARRSRASSQPRPRISAGHHDVLERREVGQQVMELEDEADLAVAERRQLALVHGRQRRGRRTTPAPDGRPVERAEHVQQRALADARLADDDHLLAAPPRCRSRSRSTSHAVPVPSPYTLARPLGADERRHS